MDIKSDEIAAIIKSATEVAKTGGEIIGALKLTEIGRAMLGEVTAEVADAIRDKVRLYRFGNQLKAIKKAEKMVADAGFTPKAVPIKLLFPLLECASLEEDEDVHTMWAALLANAASPGKAGKVRPGFIAILKQMAPDEARLLREIYDEELVQTNSDGERGSLIFSRGVLDEILEKFGWNETIFEICLERLQSQLLITEEYSEMRKEVFYVLTTSAISFLSVCGPPKPAK